MGTASTLVVGMAGDFAGGVSTVGGAMVGGVGMVGGIVAAGGGVVFDTVGGAGEAVAGVLRGSMGAAGGGTGRITEGPQEGRKRQVQWARGEGEDEEDGLAGGQAGSAAAVGGRAAGGAEGSAWARTLAGAGAGGASSAAGVFTSFSNFSGKLEHARVRAAVPVLPPSLGFGGQVHRTKDHDRLAREAAKELEDWLSNHATPYMMQNPESPVPSMGHSHPPLHVHTHTGHTGHAYPNPYSAVAPLSLSSEDLAFTPATMKVRANPNPDPNLSTSNPNPNLTPATMKVRAASYMYMHLHT